MNYGTKYIGIFIYSNDHPPPHIHVRRGGKETRVVIPTLKILSGIALSDEEEEMILKKIDFLCEEYDRLNPVRRSKI